MEVLEKLKEHYGFGSGSSYVDTHINSVRFFWSTEHVERAPLIYNAGFVIVLQGHKTGFLRDKVFEYDPDHYLVLSVPIAFECETSASESEPLLGLFVDIDMAELNGILGLINGDEAAAGGPHPVKTLELGISPVRMSGPMRESLGRLLAILCSEEQSRILGPGVLKEFLYHSLTDGHRESLRALVAENSRGERISRSIRRIRENYSQNLSIDELADEAGMSLSVYHRAFKAVTGASPHQYLKTTRLHRAKAMILSSEYSVAEAADRVGYASAAHFSREFKKHFGVPPKDARSSGYSPVDV